MAHDGHRDMVKALKCKSMGELKARDNFAGGVFKKMKRMQNVYSLGTTRTMSLFLKS